MQAIGEYLKNLRHLPPTPRIVPELMRLLNLPDVESGRIVRMLSHDPGMTANVLRISNSAQFATTLPTTDLEEAVTRLGFQQVYKIVAAATGAKFLNSPHLGYGLEKGDLWKHSVTSAVATQLVAKKVGDNENLAFTAGLLHDIGKTILSHAMSDDYGKLVNETERNGRSLLEAETKLLGTNHAEIGGRLLQHWNFPPNIVAAVWFHHEPHGAAAHQRLASCVYLGNMVSSYMGHGYGHASYAVRARSEVMEKFSLTPQSVPRLMLDVFGKRELVEALITLAV